jgi:glutathione synthase/RimK-type ligase-like ATP-grasp enzyme
MKPIAIHPREDSFSDRWIQYCQEHRVDYCLVDCYAPDIISRLQDASALLWHIGHGVATDMLMGRHVLNAAELLGLVVFPNRATQWHFDDKIAQKYMLEAIRAPLAPACVFFHLESARHWIENTTYPKVFKLRRGAGSQNVRLVRTPTEAVRLARKAFGFGFNPSGALLDSIAVWKVQRAGRTGNLWEFLRTVPRKVKRRLSFDFRMGRERGYVYFQEFIPNNEFDTRVTVIGQRAFAFRRRVRAGDFRASGSGQIVYGREAIDRECLRTAFRVAQQLGAQSMAFDFVHDAAGRPLVLEVSFGYSPKAVYDCGGFWDAELVWHGTPMWPEHAILEDVLTAVRAK